jgi:hypothetical protein
MKFWEYKEDVNDYSNLAFVDKTTTRGLLGKFLGQPLPMMQIMFMRLHPSRMATRTTMISMAI